MSLELTYLLWSAALGFLYMCVQAGLYRRQAGVLQANGPRDDDPELDVYAARGARAVRNFYETYPLFVVVVLVAQLAGTQDALTAWGCHLYFWSRLAYLPLIIFGLAPWRSIAWTVSIVGMVLIFVGALA